VRGFVNVVIFYLKLINSKDSLIVSSSISQHIVGPGDNNFLPRGYLIFNQLKKVCPSFDAQTLMN
jgi:hypothetical protein